jgi:hypothetical protein
VAVEGVDIVDGGVLSVTRTVLDVEREEVESRPIVGGKCVDWASTKGGKVSRPRQTCLAEAGRLLTRLDDGRRFRKKGSRLEREARRRKGYLGRGEKRDVTMTRRSEASWGSSEAEVLEGVIAQLTKKGVETKKALVEESTFARRRGWQWEWKRRRRDRTAKK